MLLDRRSAGHRLTLGEVAAHGANFGKLRELLHRKGGLWWADRKTGRCCDIASGLHWLHDDEHHAQDHAVGTPKPAGFANRFLASNCQLVNLRPPLSLPRLADLKILCLCNQREIPGFILHRNFLGWRQTVQKKPYRPLTI